MLVPQNPAMLSLLTRPSSAFKSGFARFAVRGVRSVCIGGVIAVAIAGSFDFPFWPTFVKSICIAISCWSLIDLGRIPMARWAHRNDPPDASAVDREWPGWPLMLVAIAIGSILGFTVGNEISSLLLGYDYGGGYFRGSWREMLALMIGSLVPGTAITYWFQSRATIAAQEAAVQVAQRQAAEHQLKLLESQLEPHMLFNTLANLRVLIGLDPVRAQTMLDQLIAFLRATLNASRSSQHSLSEEFGRLEDYFALMRIRMGDRLSTRFELPAALAELPIPPLLLQPLVENSIKHGLEPAIAGGRVDVTAERVGASLVLKVRDTGIGLHGSAGDGTRFGLVQVRERLAALYGSAATLSLAAAGDAEGGTLATIRLPISPSPVSP